MHALGLGEHHKLVHVAIGSTEVLPGWAGLAQSSIPAVPQLRNRLGQIRDLEADNRTGLKVLFARVLPTEHLHMLPIGKFEDPESAARCAPDPAQHALIELCQSLGAISTRPAPAKTPYVHARVWTTMSRIV